MSQNFYTKEEDERLKAMWNAGVPIKKIAIELGRSYWSVKERRMKFCLSRRVGVPLVWTEARNAQLAELWGQRLPVLEICDRMDVTFDSLRRQIDKLRKSKPGFLPHRRVSKKAA